MKTPKALKILKELNRAEQEGIVFNSFGNPHKKNEVKEALAEMKKAKDMPLNMPCDDPEGCKHFKAETQQAEQIKKLRVIIVDYYAHCGRNMQICGLNHRAEQALQETKK